MHIRFATENDIATLKEIIVSHYTLADAALAEKELHAMFDNQVLQPLYLVAEDQGQILGFCGYYQLGINQHGYGICRTDVITSHQGQGIGTALIHEAIHQIQQYDGDDKARFILLTAYQTRLYERLGFTVMHSFIGDNDETEYLMILPLA